MKIFLLFITSSLLLLCCQSKDEGNCYPAQPVAKTVIMVADTNILGRHFIPDNDTTRTVGVLGGLGFVKLDGTLVHKPLKQVTLSQAQQQEFLNILRPTAPQSKGTETDCIPYFRHVVLFYDSTDNPIGQMQICFGCRQVRFYPEAPACLAYFDNQRLPELKQFFVNKGIPILDDF